MTSLFPTQLPSRSPLGCGLGYGKTSALQSRIRAAGWGLDPRVSGLRGLVLPVCLMLLLLLAACDSPEERVAKHYESGLELVAEGETTRAALEFRNALKIDEDFIPARFQIAKIYQENKEFRPAIANFLRVVELDPAHGEARLRLAQLMLLAQRFDQAMEHVEVAIRVLPDKIPALVIRAALHARSGDETRAEADIEQVLATDPGNPDAGAVKAGLARRAGDTEAALAIAGQFLEANPDNPGLHVLKLQLLSERGDDAGVGRQLKEMTTRFPDNISVRRNLVTWQIREGQLLEAEEGLREVVAREPDNPELSRALIRFLYQYNGEEVAREELHNQIEAARASGRDVGLARLALAQFDYQTGKTEEAKAQLGDIIATGAGETEDEATSPAPRRARLQLARILLREEDLAEAKKQVDAIISTDARNAEALAIRAAILAEWNQTEVAVQDLRTALEESPDNAGLLSLAAQVYERNGNPVLAGESLGSAVRASNYDPQTVLRYAEFLRRGGQERAAETVLSEALNRHPTNADILSGLASIHLRQENWEEALRIAARLDKVDASHAKNVRSAALVGQGKVAEGLAILENIASSGEAAASIDAILISTYLRNGQRAEAVAHVDSLLERDSQDAMALRLKAGLELAEGNQAVAEGLFRKAIEARPGDAGAYIDLMRLFLRGDRAGEALAVTEEGLEANPENALLRTQKADLLMKQGDFARAAEEFEIAFEKQPNSLVASNNLASMISDHFSDDPEQIERAYRIARRLAGSQLPAYQDTYGWILHLRGDHNEALRYLIPAAEGAAGNPWVRYHTGMALLASGQAAEAEEHLRAALELSEGQPFPPTETIRETLDTLAASQ